MTKSTFEVYQSLLADFGMNEFCTFTEQQYDIVYDGIKDFLNVHGNDFIFLSNLDSVTKCIISNKVDNKVIEFLEYLDDDVNTFSLDKEETIDLTIMNIITVMDYGFSQHNIDFLNLLPIETICKDKIKGKQIILTRKNQKNLKDILASFEAYAPNFRTFVSQYI